MTKLTISGYQPKLENKYYKWYISIITNAITRNKGTTYHEVHHILPKSLGGGNDQQNLVSLTAREHYLVHWLLVKFTVGNDRFKMLCALNYMAYNPRNKSYYTPKIYAEFKNEHAKAVSAHHKKLWESDEYKLKMSNAARVSWSNGSRDKQLEFLKNNSPFKVKEIHLKTIDNRTLNGTNVWLTNNPMKDPIKAKKIASTRSGANHYMKKDRKFFFKHKNSSDWIEIVGMLDDELKKLGFSRATFMKMIHSEYKPKTGSLADYDVKREIL